MPLVSKSDRTTGPAPRRKVASLSDAAAEQRCLAVRAMAGKPDAAELLGAHLHAEADSLVRDAIFDVLVDLATQAALTQILACLRSENVALRNASIAAAQRLPGRIAPAIEALLCDPDPALRVLAVRILEELPHPQVMEWLTAVLWHETDSNVIGAAVDLLAEVGTPDMLPAVADVRARFAQSSYIRFACDFVATRIGGIEERSPPGSSDGY